MNKFDTTISVFKKTRCKEGTSLVERIPNLIVNQDEETYLGFYGFWFVAPVALRELADNAFVVPIIVNQMLERLLLNEET